jgi:hypothetical protein
MPAPFGGAVRIQERGQHADGSGSGTRISFAADFGYVEMGNTSFELIQPIGNDPSPYRDVLDLVHGALVELPELSESGR